MRLRLAFVAMALLIICADVGASVTYFARATATGANDGSSWEDAFTSLDSAAAVIEDADTLLLDGVFRQALPRIVNKSDILIDGSQGPSGGTLLLGERTVALGDLFDDGDGVWSFSLPERPATVTWDYRQDDTAGTVTGISTGSDEIVQAFDGIDTVRPVVAAFYGHLAPASEFSTTAPADGSWSYSGGRVYFNPPGAPSAAEIAEKVGYGSLEQAVSLSSCFNPTVRGIDAACFGNPSGGSGTFAFGGCTNVTLEDCRAWDSGYRAFNFNSCTGNDNPLGHRIRRCVALGDTIIGEINSANYPFVIYNCEGSPVSDVVLEDCAIVAYPWLGPTGRPILGSTTGQTPFSQPYRGSGFFSHTSGPTKKIGDMKLVRFVLLNMSQELNEKHHPQADLGLYFASERIAHIPNDDIFPFDGTDPNAYPIQFIGGLCYGNPGRHGNVALRGMRVIIPRPRGGLPNYYSATVGDNTWIVPNTANMPLYYEGCEMLFRRKNSAAGGIWRPLGNGNRIYLDLCTVVYDLDSVGFNTDAFFRASPGTLNVRARGTVFASLGSGGSVGGPGGSNRHFIALTSSAVGPGDYPVGAYGGLEFEGCWFYGFSTTANFFRNGSSSSTSRGRTYAEFADFASGSPLNSEGMFMFGLDPEFEEFVPYTDGLVGNDIRPLEGGSLDTVIKDPPLASLHGILGVNGWPYSGRYGAVQGAAHPCPGDVNEDGGVDLSDLSIVLNHFGLTSNIGDANGDGVVDLADLALVLNGFGTDCST